MVKIRLTRKGRKNAPSYRMVVADSRAPRDGKYIEVIGYFNPTNNPTLFEYDEEKYKSWVRKGAKPTDAVVKLIQDKYEYKPYNKEVRAREEEEKEKAEEGEQGKEQDKDKDSDKGEEARNEKEESKEDKDKKEKE